MRSAIITVVLSFASLTALAEEACKEPDPRLTSEPAAYECSGKVCTLIVNWETAPAKGSVRIDNDFLQKISQKRITPETRLVVWVRHFNFLRYGVEVEIQEKTVDTYVLLEKLWRQIFNITGAPAGLVVPDNRPKFVQALFNWRKSLEGTDAALTTYLENDVPVAVSLSGAQVNDICERINVQRDTMAKLEVMKQQALDAMIEENNVENMASFDAVDLKHREFASRVDAFVRSVRLVRDGMRKTIPQKQVGRIVTVTVKPTTLNATSEEKPFAVEYFVESALPVTYHIGLVYSRIGDVEFKTVRTVSGADLFSKIKDDQGVADLAAFLSARLKEVAGRTILGSIGTDFRDPGKRLYVGISVPVWKTFVTAGAVSASKAEGKNKILDQIVDRSGNVLETRELFDTIRTRRGWSAVFGITFRPF